MLDDQNPLDEELGYVELYKGFIEQVKALQQSNSQKEIEISALKEVIEASQVPIVFTEGKTDAALLKLAIKRLGLTGFEHWDIRTIQSQKASNNETLLRYLCELKDNMQLPMLVIGMFDRDTKLPIVADNETIDIRNKEFVKISDKIYAFSIPVPHERSETEQISIEHYFTNEEIKTEIEGKRLFMGNEFYKTGVFKGDARFYYKGAQSVCDTIKIIEHESNKYVTNLDGSGDYSISKARFVECIEGKTGSFSDISFHEFLKIFDILEKIVKDSSTDNAILHTKEPIALLDSSKVHSSFDSVPSETA